MKRPSIRLPSTLAGRYTRYVAGFGVAVPLGLAPFLGMVRVPGFSALLELFPQGTRTFLIATSAMLMGFVAIGIQFYAGETIRRGLVAKRFKATLILILISFFALVVIYSIRVLKVHDPATGEDQPVILGWSRLSEAEGCGCPDAVGDEACAEGLAYDLRTCWPHHGQVSLALHLLYMVLTGGFGALIGLLLLQEEAKRQQKAKRRSPGR